MTHRIAKQEFTRLFLSPLAWLVIVIFIVQIAYNYLYQLDYVQANLMRGRDLNDVTDRLFNVLRARGVFKAITTNLYIYVPLVTMGIFSREYSSGSFKLLMSAPVKDWQTVLGKFLALLLFGLLLVAVLGAFIVLGSALITHFDVSYTLAGAIGFYLLFMAYASIGLFISSLVSNEVVAGIATFAVIALLGNAGKIGQDIAYLNDVLYWISISGRAEQMMAGLISTKSMAYFLIVSIFFIVLTILRLQDQRLKYGFTNRLLLYFTLAGFVVLAAFISSKPGFIAYWDLTRTKENTITEASQRLVSKFRDKPLVLKTYINLLSDMTPKSGLPKFHNNDFRRFEEYVRFLPNLKIAYIYFYDTIPGNPDIYERFPALEEKEIARKLAGLYNIDFNKVLPPAEIRAQVDLSNQGNEYIRQFISGQDTSSFVRMFRDITHYPREEEISSALNTMAAGQPVIGFLAANGERTFHGKKGRDYYQMLYGKEDDRFSLLNDGFAFREINLLSRKSLKEVDILVIADPVTPYSNAQIKTIQEYIDEGRNLLVLGDVNSCKFLNPLLAPLGLSFLPGKLAGQASRFNTDLVNAYPTEAMSVFTGDPEFQATWISEFTVPVLLSGAVAIKKDTTIPASFKAFAFLKAEIEGEGKPVGMGLTRAVGERQQRIAIIGDADIIGNKVDSRREIKSNSYLFLPPLFKWFTYDEFPVTSNTQVPPNNSIRINGRQIAGLWPIFLLLIPSSIGFGAFLLLKIRHRK